MIKKTRHAGSYYAGCHNLFTDYPQAVQPVNRGGTMRSMVLMLQDGVQDGFFVLSQDSSESRSVFWIWSWPAGNVTAIEAGGPAAIPDAVASAVTQGVPIPRDGSLFGWTPGESVTALVVIYTEYTPATPVPGWAIMPLAGTAEEQWPPFTGGPLFGNWTWDRGPTGSVVSLEELVAENPDTVFWIDAKATLGSDCCAVARDLTSPAGYTLRRGRYVHYQVLRDGQPVPALGGLLASSGKIDIAARLERPLPAEPGSRSRDKNRP